MTLITIWLSGCGANPSFLPPAIANSVDLSPQDWYLLYGSGTPVHPEPLEGGAWSFDFPTDGSIHYVEVPYRATEALTGKTLTMTFQVIASDAEYAADVEDGEQGPASMHLFIEHEDDDFVTGWFRWWCDAPTGSMFLGTEDNKTITLSCPLVYSSWSDTWGQQNETEFANTLNFMGAVGMTFGGSNGWGHGVRLGAGTAQFHLLTYQIQ
jgi:hypothetical protein